MIFWQTLNRHWKKRNQINSKPDLSDVHLQIINRAWRMILNRLRGYLQPVFLDRKYTGKIKQAKSAKHAKW
jgi:hypothetical protein